MKPNNDIPDDKLKQPDNRDNTGTSNTNSSFFPEQPEIKMPESPRIELPKGGGALSGIGEKFTPNPANGSVSFSVPIGISPGRNAFNPQLSLNYDSSNGNSSFGLGWNIDIPSIARKTQSELPRYKDSLESDTYILAGAEDLVPALKRSNGDWIPDTYIDNDFQITRYRPRTEGLWSRIERWTNINTGISHWKTISKDNISSIYGENASARIADPANSKKIFRWLLEKTFDEKGNIILYEYKQENTDGLIPEDVFESNRLKFSNAFNQHYIKRIKYGNTLMYHDANFDTNNEWLFEMVFDFGEHPGDTPEPAESRDWDLRSDPFSTYRSGFEIRTYRLCQRVLMYHHFTELGSNPVLVKETAFNYDEHPVNSRLLSVQHICHAPGVSSEPLPAIEFQYTQAQIDETLRTIDTDDMNNLPAGIDGTTYTWTDLEGEGIPGILAEHERGWYYKRNTGDKAYYQDYPVNNPPEPQAGFDAMIQVSEKPNIGTNSELRDINGDGALELPVFTPGFSGFFETDEEGEWKRFKTLDSFPNVNLQDPNVKWIDLNGDGIADLFISDDRCFRYYPSNRDMEYTEVLKIARTDNENHGPALLFDDPEQSIYLADMSGDGLTDIVRIKNGEVCYWPNLTHGKFGNKITMYNAPLFDHPDHFDQNRIKLADIDGSGTTDIIYSAKDKVHYWQNQSGNRLASATEIKNVPPNYRHTALSVIDLLGKGTSCLVWSSPLPADEGFSIRYIDLMKHKPYLLKEINNNMGLIHRMHYVPSTKFYLRDRLEGNTWISRLPFPVQVLERVEVYDEISRARFVSIYAYHHGYFDRFEKEFRGFGMVEQWDTEKYDAFGEPGLFQPGSNLLDEASHTPPVYTKTWFHTGYYTAGSKISQQYEKEYFKGDTDAWKLDDSQLPGNLTATEEREAARTLRGQILRTEVYAEDDTSESTKPYMLTENNYTVLKVQPQLHQKHGVFLSSQAETISYHYERNQTDPRITHNAVLETDDYGMITQSAAIVYPRRDSGHEPEQQAMHIVYAESGFIHEDDNPNFYRIGIAYENKSFEISGITFNNEKLSPAMLKTEINSATPLNYEDEPAGSITEKRLIAWQRIYFYDESLSGSLSLGSVASHGLAVKTLTLALSPGLVNLAFNTGTTRVSETMLLNEGGYVKEENLYWLPSDTPVYDQNNFFRLSQLSDPFGNTSHFDYDNYSLFVTSVTDALNNSLSTGIDYRVLQPWEMTGINGNRQQVAFDARGMVVEIALMGKTTENLGDSLGDPTILFEYDLFNWKNNQQPNFAKSQARITHADFDTEWQISFEYSSGLGEVILQKIQAEAGDAFEHDGNGNLVTDGNGDPVISHTDTRWRGTGRTIINNKGLVVKQYEPYFSDMSGYEDEDDVRLYGVSPLLHYDPLGRNTRTDMPDGTFTKIERTPWKTVHYDKADTVMDSQWYDAHNSPDPNDPEPNDPQDRAAWLSAHHHDTPQTLETDSIGRTFRILDHNGFDGANPVLYLTKFEPDIEGKQKKVINALNQETSMLYSILPMDDEGNAQVIHTENPDSGWRMMLYDVAGNIIYAWDQRGNAFRNQYDALLRPAHAFVDEGQGEMLVGLNVYGDNAGLMNPEDDNLRGKIIRQFDQSGVIKNLTFDFKENLLTNEKQFALNYQSTIDWIGLIGLADLSQIDTIASAALETETFSSSNQYDALNRPVSLLRPDNSEILPAYNEGGMLESVEVKIRAAATATVFISDIKYNEKGQRTDIYYGNNSKTKFEYDTKTFRLLSLLTTRNSGNDILQYLKYTFDARGNIVEIQDDALQTHYFQNAVVSPNAKYEYDALYRLLKASGREHYGQGQIGESDFSINTPVPQTNNPSNVENYTESYEYDAIGNILKLIHQAGSGNWTRGYHYDTNANNHLLKSSLPGNNINDPNTYTAHYTHDAHGNMTSMPHLQSMIWDYQDMLREVDLGGGGTAFYIYSGGERVRKVIENGALVKDRLYMDGINEIYREYIGGGKDFERETLHVMDESKQLAIVETKTYENGSAISIPTPVIRYQYDNHLGSACLELDVSANIISYEEYHPFGTSAYRLGSSVAEVSLKRYRYNGKERDDETGLYYYGARYYADWLGRFISVDPLANESPDLNPYHYVRNNPVNIVDPSGMQEEEVEESSSTLKLSNPSGEGIKERSFENIIDRNESLNFQTLLLEKYFSDNIEELETISEIIDLDKLLEQLSIEFELSKQVKKSFLDEGYGLSTKELTEITNLIISGLNTILEFSEIEKLLEQGKIKINLQFNKAFKTGGKIISGFSLLVSTYELDKNPNAENFLDVTFGIIGLTKLGAPISIAYFGYKEGFKALERILFEMEHSATEDQIKESQFLRNAGVDFWWELYEAH